MRGLFLSFVVMLPVLTLAQGEAIQCPGNTTFVHIGDSLATVQQTCGQPKKIMTKKVTANGQQTTQPQSQTRWYYTSMFQGANPINTGVVTFNSQGKVASLASGNIMHCQHGEIKVGSTMSEVSQRCGLPQAQATDQQLQNTMGANGLGGRQHQYQRLSVIGGHTSRFLSYGAATAKQLPQRTDNMPNKAGSITMMIYQPHDYSPAMAFLFFDGKLAHIGKAVPEAAQ